MVLVHQNKDIRARLCCRDAITKGEPQWSSGVNTAVALRGPQRSSSAPLRSASSPLL